MTAGLRRGPGVAEGSAASWPRLLWRAASDVEWSRTRPVSGLQRAAVIALALTVTAPWLGWSMAASAGVAALLVGMLDLRQNPAARLRTMAVGTAFLTLTTLASRLLSPWPLAVVVLLAAIAFAEGAGIAVHRDAPMVLQINGFVAATALLEPQPSDKAWEAALIVLVAGSAQTIACFLYASVRGVVREVEVAAAALDDVSVFVRSVASGAGPDGHDAAAIRAMDRAARSLSAAQRLIESSDLAGDTPMLLRRVLSCADRLRIDGQALVTRSGPGIGAGDEIVARRRRLRDAADVLQQGAVALRQHAKRNAAWPGSGAFRSGTGYSRADPVSAFTAAVEAAVTVSQWQRASMRMPGERRRSIQRALRPGGLPFRFGSRIAASSLAAGLVGSAFNLSHASWSINACLSVLRPDGGGVLPRFVLRATATAVAAAGVVAEVTLVGGHRIALAAAAVAFAYLMFWLGSTNYGIYALTVTWSVLSMFAFTTPHPQRLAVARLVDTAIGCVLALAAGFLLPAWKVTQLPDVLAACSAALSRRFSSLARACSLPPGERDFELLRMTGIETRDAITDALSTFRAASVEPSRHVPVARLRAGFQDLRRCGRLAVVAEQLLSEGLPASRTSAARAAAASATLGLLPAALHDGRPVAVAAPENRPDEGELDAVMREADALAVHAATALATLGSSES